MEIETGVEAGFDSVSGGDVLDTPALALPKKTPEIHEGTIVGVTTKTSENTGNTYGIISIQSRQTGLTYEKKFFPPQAWFDPKNWGAHGFDASTLSDTPPPGKKMTPQQLFAANVSNSDAAYTKDGQVITEVIGKEAPLQLLKKLAAQEGLTLDSGTPRPTSGDEYVGLINQLVAGRLSVIFTMTPQRNDDPRYDGNLGVNLILPTSVVDAPNFSKRFQNYRILAQE